MQRLRLAPKATSAGAGKPEDDLRNRIIKRAAREFRDGMYGILFMRYAHLTGVL